MFLRHEISRAVDMQKRSYRLLRWVASAVDSHRVSFDHAHGALGMEEAARAWFTRNYDCLPSDARPAREDVEQFANLFASYLGTSFDLVEDPGSRPKSQCGCWCSYCTMMVAASHLKAKKVREGDKRGAAIEKTRYVGDLVRELGLPLEEAQICALAESKELREAVALATYGSWLLKRMRGLSCGPEVLALWRQFAWNATGAPKKDFDLSVDAITAAELRVAEEIRQRAAHAL